jgi:tRNA A37 threonylcarbamoyladenosine biosynthesis protein TsaE
MADVRRLGLAERRAEGAILLVEWAEGFEGELGAPTLAVALQIHDGIRTAKLRSRT